MTDWPRLAEDLRRSRKRILERHGHLMNDAREVLDRATGRVVIDYIGVRKVGELIALEQDMIQQNYGLPATIFHRPDGTWFKDETAVLDALIKQRTTPA